MNAALRLPAGLELLGRRLPGDEDLLTPAALDLVAALARRFRGPLGVLLRARETRQARLDAGERLDFLPETRPIREGAWTVEPPPPELLDRRVEITGPTDRKMIINALNSGASVFMADFEDSTSPTWENLIGGQQNLYDAVRRTISYEAPETGRRYALSAETAALFVRPRGLHLPERHVVVDGEPVPGGLLDATLYLFHNAAELVARGQTPALYLPKLENHREARWWEQVLAAIEDALGLVPWTVRVTVLIETLPAAFEMHEILWELRHRSLGLNCGRWDYIFSFIKTRREDPGAVLPDRGAVTMTQPFLRAYSQLLVQTCHRRGAHAMGGMSALIPVRSDSQANQAALEGVRADKLREVTDGHDGTWVAHPGLVGLAREVFDAHMPGPNQIQRTRDDVVVGAAELLAVPTGPRSVAALRHNVDVGIRYLEAWLGGLGCVPLYNLMEDAATAEICRTQVWQWLRHGATLDDGRPLTLERLEQVTAEQLGSMRASLGEERWAAGHFARAAGLFLKVASERPLIPFLTLPALDVLVEG